MGYTQKFGYAHAPFSLKSFNGILFGWTLRMYRLNLKSVALPVLNLMNPVNVPAKFEVCSFTRSLDNSGYLETLRSPWLRPRSLFSKFLMGYCSDGPCECTGQI